MEIALISAIVGALAGLVSARASLHFQRERLKAEFATEFSAVNALHELLKLHDLPYRTFSMIQHHIGGFEPNELRRLLVRAGAVRFIANDGSELWALRESVAADFRISRWKHPESPRNKPDTSELFPGVFGNSGDY
jgi:hypothetical protein